MKVVDLNVMRYAEAWALQHRLFDSMVEAKKRGEKPKEEYLLMVEHPPVVTLGKHAKKTNLLVNEEHLSNRGIDCHQIERGGDVTFHGPGQLVVYPLIDLEQHRLGVKDYVNLLEETVIRTISAHGIIGQRVEGASGVWIGKGTPSERKICALGVKCSRFCTMHGLALNVNTDLEGFSVINPCGFVDKGVTSMKRELGHEVNINEVKAQMAAHFRDLLAR